MPANDKTVPQLNKFLNDRSINTPSQLTKNMSIFEDLVTELKEENLLEETVMSHSEKDSLDKENRAQEAQHDDQSSGDEECVSDEQTNGDVSENREMDARIPSVPVKFSAMDVADDESGQADSPLLADEVEAPKVETSNDEDEKTAELFSGKKSESDEDNQEPDQNKRVDEDFHNGWDLKTEDVQIDSKAKDLIEPQPDLEDEKPPEVPETEETEKDAETVSVEEEDESVLIDEGDQAVSADETGKEESDDNEEPEKDPKAEKELYCQRLVDEVSSLQAVEHILNGVEREQMRVTPNSYDVVPVKQILHEFVEEFKQLDSIAQTESETELRTETERWHSALLERDKTISTASMRRYCEVNNLNTKSLYSLARFYRNSDFSESVRSKFDLVVTRLFSQESTRNKREMVMERDDLIKSLNDLYAEWSSIPVYSVDDEDSELVLAAFKFEDFISEAKKTKHFDGLITSGFFKRIKAFKKKTGENFFAPLLIASAVECNVAIGNRYIDLIAAEKKKTDVKKIGDKYGGTHDRFVSEAASKTLKLVELLKDRAGESADKQAKSVPEPEDKVLGINTSNPKVRIAIIIALAVGLLASGYFIYTSFYGETRELTATEKKVKLERSFLHEYVKSAKIIDSTFSGQVKPAWDDLTKSKKEEVVGKIYAVGKSKGYNKVELKGEDGKIVAVTLGTNVEIAE